MSQRRFYGLLGVAGIIVALIVAIVVLSSRLDLRTMQRDQARRDVAAHRTAHAQTILNYRAAAAAAQAEADKNLARVAAEQAAITERTIHDYEGRLAAVDARLVRVRADIAAHSGLGDPGLAPVSLTRDATCQAYGGTSCDGLLAKLATAEKQAWNLIALREWAARQGAVASNPEKDVK